MILHYGGKYDGKINRKFFQDNRVDSVLCYDRLSTGDKFVMYGYEIRVFVIHQVGGIENDFTLWWKIRW